MRAKLFENNSKTGIYDSWSVILGVNGKKDVLMKEGDKVRSKQNLCFFACRRREHTIDNWLWQTSLTLCVSKLCSKTAHAMTAIPTGEQHTRKDAASIATWKVFGQIDPFEHSRRKLHVAFCSSFQVRDAMLTYSPLPDPQECEICEK